MSISLKTHKLLWGKSGNRCAFKSCRIELVMTEHETGNKAIIGEEAHIVAKNVSGPRGDNPITLDLRDEYENLILLCRHHHKLIDDNPINYSVDDLRLMKEEHENWIKNNLDYDKGKESTDSIVASYIDVWLCEMKIDQWIYWSSDFILVLDNYIEQAFFDKFVDIERYIKSRIWPKGYENIEKAFKNFSYILHDIRIVFLMYSKTWHDNYCTEKFHKLKKTNEYYWQVFPAWEFHTGLIADLGLELTRAANHICDQVRKDFHSSFRLKEGLIMIGSERHLEATYKPEELEELYPGLNKFMDIRHKRNTNFGEGRREEYTRI